MQPLVLGKVKVTAGPNPGDHRVGVATENNAIYMVDAVSGTLARCVVEDGRRVRIREVAPLARRPTSGKSASESPVLKLGAWATRATTHAKRYA